MRNSMRLTLLCGAAVLLPLGQTWAQTSGQCAIAPTCGELGYEQKATDCAGQHMLKCPFDNSKVFCGGVACDYTNTSLPSGCANADSCIDSKGKIYYSDKCETCYIGYTLSSSGTCSQTCTYTSTSKAHCSSYKSCQLGSSTYYQCTSCEVGYHLDRGECDDCTDYCLNAHRTSGPYTDEYCDLAYSSPNNRYVARSMNCGGLTYYGCGNYSTSCTINDPLR